MKRKRVYRSRKVSYDFKHFRKKFFYKLFTVLLIVLFFVALAWLIFFILQRISPVKETGLEGELRSLKWDFGKEEVVLDVLNYAISLGNQTVEVNINWSSGNKSINSIFINFVGISGGCNYTKINDLVFGENKTYAINWSESICSEADFSNITDVEAYAQVSINLTQIALISNMTFYNDDGLNDVIDLDSYFSCLVNVSYSVIEEPNNDYLLLKINETTHLVSFIKGEGWYGIQKFNLTAISDDGEVLDTSTNGENMSFYAIFINETRALPNNAPTFNSSYCDNLEWDMNKSYILDLKKCFYDEDNGVLTFRYENSSERNLSISRSGDELTLNPATNWNGTGYFYVYANDSEEETRGEVDFIVFRRINITANITTNQTNLTANQTNATANNTPSIKSYSPGSENINISFNGSLELSIEAENYDSIKWYVDGVLVKSNVSSYTAEKLSEGVHEIKVEVTKGSEKIYKAWNLFVSGEEIPKKDFFVYFVIILVSIGILILVVVFFIVKNVIEKKEENAPKPVIKELKPGIRAGYILPSRTSS